MSTGPNIGLYGLVFSNEEYTQHGEGCRGYIGVPTRRHGLVMAGRARCLKCGRWVGRKAWRDMSRSLQDGVLDWDTMYDKGDNWRVFVRIAPDKRRPDPPSRQQHLHSGTGPTNPCSEQQVRGSARRSLREGATRYLRKPSRAVDEILTALKKSVDGYQNDEVVDFRKNEDEVIDCELVDEDVMIRGIEVIDEVES